MKNGTFSLRPFPAAGPVPAIIIRGDVERRCRTFSISFALSGKLDEIVVAQAELPERKKGLWEGTCLEFFLGRHDSDRYWEFNLSPAGHWNVYRFSGYRQGMHEEPAFTALPFVVLARRKALTLSLELDLDRIIPSDKDVYVGIGAVVRGLRGETTYWALTHRGHRPDFHRRDCFTIEL